LTRQIQHVASKILYINNLVDVSGFQNEAV